ncbi:MAG: hypothetical protein IKZ87_05430 [Actinomycetaceae bacterium]|nr:hypothetical protein [Actinomycetaceae bacterium]
MRTMIVVPDGYELEELGENVTVVSVPPNRAVAFDFLPPHGTFLVLAQPERVRDIPALLEAASSLAPTHRAIAFLPEEQSQRDVLATAAAAYAFDALTLHLAGGLDSTIPLSEMCLDAMIRLAGRGAQPIATGHPSVSTIPALDIGQYLRVISRNFSADTQARHLAPVFLATVTAPMKASDTNTDVLDLERTPYTPSKDVTARELPQGSNDGVLTATQWVDGLKNNSIANQVLRPFRRRPDALLPNVSDFFDEALRATGVETSTAQTLRAAFAEIAEKPAPHVLFAISGKPDARARMDAIRSCLPYDVSYWDSETSTLYVSSAPEASWAEADDSNARSHPIVYLIDIQVHDLPWLKASDAIVIADFTCSDVYEPLAQDMPVNTAQTRRSGYHAALLDETLMRADRVIARDNSQRDFLLGAVAGLGRLDQYTYDEDLSLSSLVTIETETHAACEALDRCLHPFDAVTSNPEYEQTIFDAAAPPPLTFSQRIVSKAKRTILGGGR